MQWHVKSLQIPYNFKDIFSFYTVLQGPDTYRRIWHIRLFYTL